MKTNAAGRRLIMNFEGGQSTDGLFRAYLCPSKVWTIGYGHTGPDVTPGLTVTQAEAEALLDRDLVRFERAVLAAVTVPLTQNQFSALVSFCYNVGIVAFQASTLLRRLNAGDTQGAAAQFHRWVNGASGVLPGLIRRRQAEAALFATSDSERA